MELPLLVIGNVSFVPNGKPVIVIENGEATEFGDVAVAKADLVKRSGTDLSARHADIYQFDGIAWRQRCPETSLKIAA